MSCYFSLLDLRSSECDVVSLYFMCCSVKARYGHTTNLFTNAFKKRYYNIIRLVVTSLEDIPIKKILHGGHLEKKNGIHRLRL